MKHEARKCSCSCDGTAVADARWGSDTLPAQTGSLCQAHLDELWGMLGPLLGLNKAWLTLDRPGALTAEPEGVA